MKKIIATMLVAGSLLACCDYNPVEEAERQSRLKGKLESAVHALDNQENIFVGGGMDPFDDKVALMHYLCRFEKDDLSSWGDYFVENGYDISKLERAVKRGEYFEDKNMGKFLLSYTNNHNH